MADGRKNNGGHSTKGKAGRPSKAEEQKLIEKLTPLAPKAHKALEAAVRDREQWAVKLFFEYFYGRPVQGVDLSGGIEFKGIKPLEWVEDDKQ